MRVLLSIKPVHVENIVAGTKTFEFRRRLFARRDVKTVLIYATMPVGRFVGEFDIETILQGEPETLWGKTKAGSGISKDYYDAYFAGRSTAFALKISNLRLFSEPVRPLDVIDDFTPPQSYMYIAGQGLDIRRGPQLQLL
jgi:predicted transcriptional regulator